MSNTYQQLALVTESKLTQGIKERFEYEEISFIQRLMTVQNCLSAADFDSLKRRVFYMADHTPEQAVLLNESDPDSMKIRFCHGLMGLLSEIFELLCFLEEISLDFTGCMEDPRFVNLFEELGDLEWYHKLMESSCFYKAEDVQDANIAKLLVRYQGRFNSFLAANRNLISETKALVERQKHGPKPITNCQIVVDPENEEAQIS
jgi:hypothetical protein